MSLTTIPASASSGGYGFQADAQQAARALLGTSVLAEWYEEMYQGTRFGTSVSGTGAVAIKNAPGGVYSLTTGATSSSLACMFMTNTQIYSPSAETWYCRIRGAIPAAVGAGAQLMFGPFTVGGGGAPGFGIGVDGAVSTTKYVIAAYNAVGTLTASAQFTTSIDTAEHVYEFWSLGANTLYGRIDGGAVSSIGFSSQPASQFAVTARNRTDSVAYQMDLDAFAFLSARGA